MQALDGIRVLDLTQLMAGPFCTQILGDMGADVIKIERPGKGDEGRAQGPPFLGGESPYFMSVNRNKRSLTLNLKTDQGKEIFRSLVREADVLVENYRPGAMARLGLDYESLRAINPRLVYASVSGFGQTGPYREKAGLDLILQGMGGLMAVTGEVGGNPVKVGVPVVDLGTGVFAALGIMFALFARERTNRGQYVDASLMDSVLAWMTFFPQSYLATGQLPRPLGSMHPVSSPYQAFRTKDIHINVGAALQDAWTGLCQVLGVEHLTRDPRFRTNADRVQNRTALTELLEEAFGREPADVWLARLEEKGIPCGPINNMDRILTDPQVRAREMVVTMEHPVAGTITVMGVPVKLSETPGSPKRRPPLLGEHTAEVLAEIGCTPEQIAELTRQAVI